MVAPARLDAPQLRCQRVPIFNSPGIAGRISPEEEFRFAKGKGLRFKRRRRRRHPRRRDHPRQRSRRIRRSVGTHRRPARTSVRNLTCIYSPLGCPPSDGCPCPSSPGIDPLLANGQVSRLVSAFPFVSGASSIAEDCWRTGALEIEIVPQGILAERLRAGGAGLGGVFLPPATGTRFAHGKETRVLDGRDAVFEPALKAHYSPYPRCRRRHLRQRHLPGHRTESWPHHGHGLSRLHSRG